MAALLDPSQKKREGELAQLLLDVNRLFLSYTKTAIQHKEAGDYSAIQQTLAVSSFKSMGPAEVVAFIKTNLADRGMKDFKVEPGPDGQMVVIAPPSPPLVMAEEGLQQKLAKVERKVLVGKSSDSSEYQAAFTSFISALSGEFAHVEDPEQMKSLISSWSKVFDNFVQGRGGEYLTLYDYMTQAPAEYRTMSLQDNIFLVNYEIQPPSSVVNTSVVMAPPQAETRAESKEPSPADYTATLATSSASGVSIHRASISQSEADLQQITGLSSEQLLQNPVLANYAGLGEEEKKAYVQQYLPLILADYNQVMQSSSAVQMQQREAAGVDAEQLMAEVALTHFMAKRLGADPTQSGGIDRYVIQSIVQKESNWIPSAKSPTGALGLFQFVSISVADMNISKGARMKKVNAYMAANGLKPFDENLGKYYDEKSGAYLPLKAGSGAYKQALSDPGLEAEMTCWLLVRKLMDAKIKSAPNSLSDQNLSTLFKRYNGDVEVQTSYSQSALAMTLQRRQSGQESMAALLTAVQPASATPGRGFVPSGSSPTAQVSLSESDEFQRFLEASKGVIPGLPSWDADKWARFDQWKNGLAASTPAPSAPAPAVSPTPEYTEVPVSAEVGPGQTSLLAVLTKRVEEVAAKDGKPVTHKEAQKTAYRIYLGEKKKQNLYVLGKNGRKRYTQLDLVRNGEEIHLADGQRETEDAIIRSYLNRTPSPSKSKQAEYVSVAETAAKLSDKQYSRDPSAGVYVCSSLSHDAIENVLGHSIKVTKNIANSQYVQLVRRFPNIDEKQGTVTYDSPGLAFLQNGTTLQLPAPDGTTPALAISKLESQGLRAYFEAGANRYVASGRMVEGRAQTVIGLASGGLEAYPSGGARSKDIAKSEKLQATDRQYYEIKRQDPNQAGPLLANLYDALISSQGTMQFAAYLYNNHFKTDERHALMVEYVYRTSDPMVPAPSGLNLDGAALISQVNKFFANVPSDAKVSQSVNPDGTIDVKFSWAQSGVRTSNDVQREERVGSEKWHYADNVQFNSVLHLEPKSGTAYYSEVGTYETAHAESADARFSRYVRQETPDQQFIPLAILPQADGSFKLEFNHLVLFENTKTDDPTRRMGSGTNQAHVLFREQFFPNARTDEISRKAYELNLQPKVKKSPKTVEPKYVTQTQYLPQPDGSMREVKLQVRDTTAELSEKMRIANQDRMDESFRLGMEWRSIAGMGRNAPQYAFDPANKFSTQAVVLVYRRKEDGEKGAQPDIARKP
ncbi:Transglycosylase SLT domain protein [uncultured archaeon]|nr:Transglycosylase SLT domain protein [uncultured archaeon]